MFDEGPLESPLFLACTRPALYGGVPVEAVAASLMAGLVAALLMGNLLWMWPVGFTLGGLAKIASRKDPLIFRVYAAWIDSRPKAADFGDASKRTWGGISVSPLRSMRGYKREELGRNV